MSDILYVTSPMPPSVNHYTGIRNFMKQGRIQSIVYETKEAVEYKKVFKQILEQAIKEQNWTHEVNSTQHFYVDAIFYFDRIDKDAANYEKCLSDTITETQLIWKDDNVTLFRPQRIYYDRDNPRIELTIYPVDYIGIFDSQEDYISFELHCKTCKRYKRNCSILHKAVEGRVQSEICNGTCEKYSGIKGNA